MSVFAFIGSFYCLADRSREGHSSDIFASAWAIGA